MLLVRSQHGINESVVNAAYVKSWELNMEFETRILCHIAGECTPRVLRGGWIKDWAVRFQIDNKNAFAVLSAKRTLNKGYE